MASKVNSEAGPWNRETKDKFEGQVLRSPSSLWSVCIANVLRRQQGPKRIPRPMPRGGRAEHSVSASQRRRQVVVLGLL